MYLLFDLDGTLTEPVQGITNSIKYALAKFGIEERDERKLRLCIGPPLIDAFMEHWGFERAKAVEALAAYREYFSVKGIYENEIYEGIKELLEELKARGHHIILATSKPEEYARQILDHFSILPYFDAIVGNTLKEDRPRKQDVLAYICKLYPDLSPENALMIGDRMYDVEGARVLGLNCIGVLYGHGSEKELSEAGAKYVVPSVTRLRDLLRRIAL